jgi:hypothetical protein
MSPQRICLVRNQETKGTLAGHSIQVRPIVKIQTKGTESGVLGMKIIYVSCSFAFQRCSLVFEDL